MNEGDDGIYVQGLLCPLYKENMDINVKEIPVETMAERHEFFRRRLQKAKTRNEDVMRRYYGIENNGYQPILIEKNHIDRIIDYHGKDGYVVVSPCKSGLDKDTNDRNTRQMIQDLEKSGYSYLPTYKKTGAEADYEASFLLFNHSIDGSSQNFAIDRNGVLLEVPGEDPIYVNPIPATLTEQMRRTQQGEVMIFE